MVEFSSIVLLKLRSFILFLTPSANCSIDPVDCAAWIELVEAPVIPIMGPNSWMAVAGANVSVNMDDDNTTMPA